MSSKILFGGREKPVLIKEGDGTSMGLVLTKNPSLLSDPKIKFAVFDHPALFDTERYAELVAFLPKEFSFIEPPKDGQNCFGYALDLEDYIDKWEFDGMLYELNYIQCDKDSLENGVVVAYCGADPEFTGFKHAGIYIGDERVRSRWGRLEVKGSEQIIGGPVVEHPLEEVLPGRHYIKELGICPFFFKKEE